MNAYYFIEVNFICVIFLAFINLRLARNNQISLGDKVFRFSIRMSELLCISDAVAGVLSGKVSYGIRLISQIANIVYFSVGALIAACWLYFVCIKAKVSISKSRLISIFLPSFVTFIIAITNPITNLLYVIDENNIYNRGTFLFIYWIIVFFYLTCSTALSVRMTYREYNKIVKRANISFCLFGVFPTIGFLMQLVFYGSSTISVGVALGYLFYYIRSLEFQISEDFLTGLNNRKQLERFASDLVNRGCDNPIFIMMMDVNDFKQINDKYGHVAGDEALIDFATALKNAGKNWHGTYIMCRYGGDEFSVVGELEPGSNIEAFVSEVRKNMKEITVMKNRKFNLEASFGYSYAMCKTASDLYRLHNEADEKMYEEKKRMKAEKNYKKNEKLLKK